MSKKSRFEDCCEPKDCVICQNILTENAHLRCRSHMTSIFDSPIQKVKQEVRRARSKNLQADLTFHQWITALDFFQGNLPNGMIAWCCAYCGRYVGVDLGVDHWNPMSGGGGTTVTNCVPCCLTCNVAKNVLTGDEFFGFLIDAYKSPVASQQYKRAQRYFQLLRQGISIREYLSKENHILDYLEKNADTLPFSETSAEADVQHRIQTLRKLRESDKRIWDGVDVQDYVEITSLRTITEQS